MKATAVLAPASKSFTFLSGHPFPFLLVLPLFFPLHVSLMCEEWCYFI